MEKILETLKELYSNSTDMVFIFDYEFKILWRKKNKKSSKEKGSNMTSTALKKIFRDKEKPLKSDRFFLDINGIEYPCNLINYEQQKLYVLQISAENAMYTAMNSKNIQEFNFNQSAQIRHAVNGISIALSAIDDSSGKKSSKITKPIKIISGNCYKLLKASANISALAKYTKEDSDITDIRFLRFLEEFSEESKIILSRQIKIHLNAKSVSDLSVRLDPEGFCMCMLSLVVYTAQKNPDTCEILINAENKGDHASLTVSVKIDAEFKAKKGKKSLMSKFIPLYAGDPVNTDLLVVQKFCDTYDLEFSRTCDPDTGITSCTLNIPCFEPDDKNIIFKSEDAHYTSNEKFSPMNVAYSDIADIY